jgi:Cu+-exporting ATPase
MWDALKHRTANMHTLIALGITAAFLYSVVAVAWPGIFPNMALAEVFWDVTDVVVALVVLGLALEIKAPHGQSPTSAHAALFSLGREPGN